MIVQPFRIKAIVRVILWTSIWINISEVFRYFSIVRPNIQRFFNHQEGIAAMDWIIFSIWGVWDMLLTTMVVLTCWLFINILGNNRKSIVLAATFSWSFLFVLFWIACANMGLSHWDILVIVLPLCWLEMVIACFIAFKIFNKYQ